MNRRRAAAVLAAGFAAAAGFAGPGSTPKASAADEAATVNGESISIDEFEAAVEESGAVDPATGTADATVARTTLSGLIADTARVQFLGSHGVTADEATAAEQLQRLQAPDVADLEEVYEDRPASLGVICARLIPVADVDDGAAAVEALAGGTAFADVAQQYSVDPAVVEADGWLTGDPTNPCVPLTELQFDATLANTFVEATPGEPVGPVVFERPQGDLIFVIEVAPFDEVATAIESFYAGAEEAGTSAGELLFRGWLLDADVTVHPRYGRWDAASASIVPLGQP